MKVSFIALGILVVSVVAAYAAVQVGLDQYSWNYKITINIETPEGIKSGSAVREVTNRDNTIFGEKIPEAGARISSVKGEAVVVDLGARGVVFGLIEHGSYGELYSAFGVANASNTTEGFDRLKTGAKAALPEENWPMFVTFTERDDPKSVTLVQGWKFNSETQKQVPVRRFAEQFGDGMQIKDIVIEIVDEPVTWKINEILPWLPQVKQGTLDGSKTTHSLKLSNILHYGRFKQGEEK
ncbi:MAG: hypothetical protein IT559_00380 [Alphaproteobacteria bacterium]|nr:hypothetical protein [Alphaproteobacteria bacterium]